MVKMWNVLLVALTNMLREALIMPGPYVASSVAGSIIAYAMSISNDWNVFGISIGVAVAFALASFEILSVRTMIKLWRVKTQAFYAAMVVSVFALIIEWIILILADSKLPSMLRIVGIAFCILPGIMYLLQALNEWTDEQIGSTRQKEEIDTQLEIERKQKEQLVQLELLAEQAKWEVEQQRIKLQNTQEKALAKISVQSAYKNVQKGEIFTFLKENPDIGATEAANTLGVSRRTIYNYREELSQNDLPTN